jgi:hypothetical protein
MKRAGHLRGPLKKGKLAGFGPLSFLRAHLFKD